MAEQHNHNVKVEGSNPSISTIEYTKNITIAGYNLGYPYFIDYDHPLATGNSGRVLVHRHVASIKAGRWLKSDEVVHHLDHNKLNFSSDNLQLLSKGEHTKLHNLEHAIKSKECAFCKIIFTPKESRIIYCSKECTYSAQTKAPDLTKNDLENKMPYHTWASLGRLYGYSGNGIKHRANKLGCDMSLIRSKKK